MRLEQVARVDTQGSGETVDIVDTYVTFAPLDAAHVRTVNPSNFGQFFLAQAELQSQLADAMPESDAMFALNRDCRRHSSSVGVCTL